MTAIGRSEATPSATPSTVAARILASHDEVRVDLTLASGARSSFRLNTVEQPRTCARFLEEVVAKAFVGASPRMEQGMIVFGGPQVSGAPTEAHRLPVLLGSVVAFERDGHPEGRVFGVWLAGKGIDFKTAQASEGSGPLMIGTVQDGLNDLGRLSADDRIVDMQVRMPQRAGRTTIRGFEVWPPHECPTFADIGGMHQTKDQLNSTIGVLARDPARAAQLRLAFNGVLLHGPLGTGKSLFARALAGEYGYKLVFAPASPLRSAPADAPQRLEEAFEVARSQAPCLLFFDEFDWLISDAANRPALESVLDRLMRLVASIAARPDIIVVAATEAIDKVDPMFLRPGLFDLRIRVGLPDPPARTAILKSQLGDRPTAGPIDFDDLAARVEGSSAAALTAIVNSAALRALGRTPEGAPGITQGDLASAISERATRDRPAIGDWTWEQLILPDETKQELRELQRLIEEPTLAKRFGIAPPRGALLHGPPGTGKTTIARVLAAQAETSFYPVKGSDIVSKWLGESEQRVHELFERARQNRPAIVFIDEIDALGAARGAHADGGAMDRILNQILQEIDGLESGAGVFVLGATNRMELLDEALLRGGRLGRHIFIPVPDHAGRVALLKFFTKAMPLAADVELERLAEQTDLMSGADLQQLCQQAAIGAMMRASADVAEIHAADFNGALDLAATRRRRSPPSERARDP